VPGEHRPIARERIEQCQYTLWIVSMLIRKLEPANVTTVAVVPAPQSGLWSIEKSVAR
jgi:hypothetical protein